MKRDVPVARADFFAAAEKCGFQVVDNVSVQRLKVAAIPDDGPILRYFTPDLRVLPEGTQVNGYIGIALPSDESLFLHILNVADLRALSRIVSNDSDWTPLFEALRRALNALPCNLDALAKALRDPSTWLGRQVAWGDAPAIDFAKKVHELVAS